jgi:predicted esterase/tetratricopeptide (TPR) repeat protein
MTQFNGLHRRIAAAFIWLVSLPAAPAEQPVVPPAAELRTMLARYEQYLGLSPAERSRTKRPEFEHPPLSREAAAAWRTGLCAAWKEQLVATRPERPEKLGYPAGWIKPGSGVSADFVQTDWWPKPDEQVRVTMRYGARTAGDQPDRGWPVFINLHGGGNNPQANDVGWASTMGQYPIRQGLYVCPRAPVDSVGSWNDPRSIAALERLVVELPTKWEIDPDRVYLMGFSMGAIGVLHIGPSLPDRWAAVAATSGFNYVGAAGRAALENLFSLPVMIQIGTADMDFQRYPLAKAYAEAVTAARGLTGAGYPLEFKEHVGVGHQVNDRDAPDWLARQRRDPLPKRIIWHQPLLELPLGIADTPRLLERSPGYRAFLRRRCYWLRNDAPLAFQRLDVSRAGNDFRIDAAGHVERVTLLLDDRIADLDQPVRVLAGERELASVRVPRTVTALVASLVEYGDPGLMFCAELDVAAPDGVAELERGQPTTASELRTRAQDRMAARRFADAAVDLEAALRLDAAPAPVQLRLLRDLYQQTRDTAGVVDTSKRLAAALPDDVNAQTQAASVLLNVEPEGLRDEKAALRHAERAMEIVKGKHPGIAGVLALAQFRNGRREEAVETVKRALELVPADRAPELRAQLQAALETYGGVPAK